MLGYDISWAAFNIIEVMSSPKFTYKVLFLNCINDIFNHNIHFILFYLNCIYFV